MRNDLSFFTVSPVATSLVAIVDPLMFMSRFGGTGKGVVAGGEGRGKDLFHRQSSARGAQ